MSVREWQAGKRWRPALEQCAPRAWLMGQPPYSAFFSGSRSGRTSPVFLRKRTFLPSTILHTWQRSAAAQGDGMQPSRFGCAKQVNGRWRRLPHHGGTPRRNIACAAHASNAALCSLVAHTGVRLLRRGVDRHVGVVHRELLLQNLALLALRRRLHVLGLLKSGGVRVQFENG